MKFEFSYTPEDLQEIQRAKWPKALRQPTMQKHVQNTLAVWIATLIPWGLLAWKAQSFYILVAWLIAGSVICGAAIWRYRRFGKSQWKANINFQQPHTLIVEGDGIKIMNPLATTDWRWQAFNYWTESKNLFLLRIADKRIFMIPKRAVPHEQMEDLRNELQQRIESPTGGFPVNPVTPPPDDVPARQSSSRLIGKD